MSLCGQTGGEVQKVLGLRDGRHGRQQLVVRGVKCGQAKRGIQEGIQEGIVGGCGSSFQCNSSGICMLYG